MELRHLRYFIALAEEMSFTRGATRLHIAQPALSIQIRNLETEIGAQLISREGRKIRLTAAGEVFLERAREMLRHVERSISLTQQAAHGEIGHLAIGHNGISELLLFPRIVPAFKKKWPHVHLTFHNLRTPRQVEKLRRDELDVAFVWLPVSTEEFEVQELMDVPLVAVLPERHRLARAPSVSVKDLSGEPLILLARGMDTDSFHQIERLFLHAGAVMNVVHEFEILLSIINFVAMECGCSILPNYARRILDGVVYKPLKPASLIKSLAIARKKRRGDLAEVFYQFAIQNLGSPAAKRRSR